MAELYLQKNIDVMVVQKLGKLRVELNQILDF